MVRRSAALVVAVTAVGSLAGCASDGGNAVPVDTEVEITAEPPADDPGDPISPPRVRTTNPETCVDAEFDVESEPQHPEYAPVIDWFRDGCRVRIDVLTERLSAELACGVTTGHIIEFGGSIVERLWAGNELLDSPDLPSRLTFRDRGDMATREPDADPASTVEGAAFSGYESADAELWVNPDNLSEVYLATEFGIERWPRGEENVCG